MEPQATYRFKHALIQDAAYESLLKSRRQALHRRAAEALLREREGRARGDRASFHRGRPRRSRDRMVGQGGRPGAAPLGLPGGDRPSRQGDRHGGQGGRDGAAGDRRLGRSEPATDAVARRLRQRAHRGARLRRAGNDGSLRQSPRVGVWRQGCARTIGGRLRPVGRQLRARRVAVDAGARGGLPQRRRGETRFARGRRRPSRRRDHVLVRRRVSSTRAIIWNARSPCSNPAATTIWPFASDRTPASPRWPILRLRHGRSARSIARFRSSTRMQTRIAGLTHVGTLAYGRMHAAMFELMRGDHARAAPNAFELARLAREHDLPLWRAFGVFLEGWATPQSGAAGGGLEDMRRGVELLREQNVLIFDGLLKIALAEAEARAGDLDRAIAILDEALATCDRTGHRAFEAELHRARGEILLKRDPANPAPAEEAFQTAIAVAKQQGTRSFELRAALALAKLYQSTGRPADAHAVLAPALEGFAPTPEMPEIAEAQALLAALARNRRGQGGRRAAAATDAVAGRLRQRAHRGARLRRAGNDGSLRQSPRSRRLATRTRPNDWRPTTACGSAATCEANLPSMRAHAAAFLSDVEARPDSPEAGVAHRAAGHHLLVRRRVSRSAGSSGTRARLVPTRPRRRSGLSLRTGPRRRRDGLSGDCVVASRRGRSRDFAHRPHADADRGPHPCRHARVRKNARGHVRIDARRPRARRAERLRTRPPRARARSALVSRVWRVSRGLGDRCERRGRRAGSRTCAAASSCCANRTS